MVDGLDCLRHHIVVSGNDDYTDICHLGSTGTHGGERFVTRGVEECDMAAVGQLHIVGADMLGDTSGLTGNDIGFTDIVEQRSLTMVDMTHNGHYRRTVLKIFFRILLLRNSLNNLSRNEFGLEPEFLSYDIDGLGIKALVNRHHHPEVHACAYNLVDGNIHHRSEVVGCHKLCELKCAAFSSCHFGGFALTLGNSLAFLLTPLHTAFLPFIF